MRKKSDDMSRKVPVFSTDDEAAAFLDQDLSDLEADQFKPVSFEFQNKTAQLNMRVPKLLLDALKERASERGIPYTRYIRQLMERDLNVSGNVSRKP